MQWQQMYLLWMVEFRLMHGGNQKYTITILDLDGNTVSQKSVQRNSSYTLPEGYWYINGSTTEYKGGDTYTVTSNITLKPVASTVTVIHVDGTTTTERVAKGSTYTLGSNLKWKVGDSTELADGGTVITVDKNITVTESNQITIIYTVDTSTNATGLDAKYKYDDYGITIPTVQENNTYTIIITYANGTTTENVSDKYLIAYDSEHTSSGVIDKPRTVLEFVGWAVNGNFDNVINAEEQLDWDTLYNNAQNGVINLNTKWKHITDRTHIVNFFIRYDSIAVDAGGNVTGRDSNKYTPSLWGSYVGGNIDKSEATGWIKDTTSDNSYTADQKIRALEGIKEDGSMYIYNIPTDDYIFNILRTEYPDSFSVDGIKVNPSELSSEYFEVRWYVFKYQGDMYSGDAWHVDGKIVRKQGKMVLQKEFNGYEKAITEVSNNYYIEMSEPNTMISSEDTLIPKPATKLTLDSATKSGNTYTWILDIQYGVDYVFTEKNYTGANYNVDVSYMVTDPDANRYRKIYNTDGTFTYAVDEAPIYRNQSSSGKIDSVEIKGVNNYASDYIGEIDTSNILKLKFSNTYAPTSAITIKKEDSASNNGLANAQFSLYKLDENGNYDKNSPLKFKYDESIYKYNESGSQTVLTSPTGGAIILDQLPSGNGEKYKLVEISVPEGYDGNSSVDVELNTEAGVIVPVITLGTAYDEKTKVLEVDNASKLTTVKVNKIWQNDVPESYINNVTVKLYLNNMPISTYDLRYDLNGDGTYDTATDQVQEEVVLNADNNWTYTWNNLPLYIDGAKAVYSVREVQIGEIKAVTNGQYNSEAGTWESADAYTQYRAHTTAQTETKDEDGNVTQVSVDLINTIHLVRININKISPLGVAIDGVKFKLQKVDDSGNIDSTFEARELITSSDGKLSFVDLEYDTKYLITEIEGNKGYYLDSTPIYVIINKGVQGQEDNLTLYTDSTFEQEAQAGDYEYVSLNDAKDTLNIINISHTPMPKAGGCGVYSFYILGIFLMGCSTIIIYLRKNKIKKGK